MRSNGSLFVTTLTFQDLVHFISIVPRPTASILPNAARVPVLKPIFSSNEAATKRLTLNEFGSLGMELILTRA